MRHPLRALPAVLVAGCAVCAAGAGFAGPWESYTRPYDYRAVAVQGDTVWCATLESGLLQYRPQNGTPDRFVTVHREPGGLASNHLTALAIERTRRLWVGTEGSGASRLSADRLRWDLIKTFDGLPEDSITVLVAQGDSVWIGTTKGIALWNGNTIAGAIPNGVDPSPFANDHITGIVPRGDSLWLSTLDGVYVTRISTGFQTWSRIDTGLLTPSVQALVQAGTQLLLVANKAPFVFDDAQAQWNYVPNDGSAQTIGVVERLCGARGVVTASTINGIFRWTADHWTLIGQYASPAESKVQFQTGVAEDGRVWAANQNGLMEQGSGLNDWPLHPANAAPGNDVTNLYPHGSSLYVNTFTEGFGRFNGTAWYDWPPAVCSSGCDSTFLSSFFLFSLLVDRRGHKWVGAWSSALEELDDSVSPTAFTHHVVNDPVTAGAERHTFGWSAVEDRRGGHWIGLAHNGIVEPIVALGIDYYDSLGNFVRNFRPDSVTGPGAMRGTEVRAMHRAARPGNDRILVGYSERGPRGLQWFDLPSPGQTPFFVTVAGTENLEVIGIATFGDSLWVLTTQDLRRYGLTGLNLQAAFARPGSSAENSLHPLDVGPDGTVWIGSENGLRALRPGNVVTDYTVSNSPLLDNRVRAIRVDPVTGAVWVGTGGGVNRFDPYYVPPGDAIPDRLTIQAYPNPSMLTAIGVPIRLRGNGSRYTVDVFDVRGRRMRHIVGVGNDQVFWNARDDDGNLVRPGIYFIHAETGGRTATARVALIR